MLSVPLLEILKTVTFFLAWLFFFFFIARVFLIVVSISTSISHLLFLFLPKCPKEVGLPINIMMLQRSLVLFLGFIATELFSLGIKME